MWTQTEWSQHAIERMRANDAAAARGRKAVLRDRRVDILATGIAEAIARAPDVFEQRIDPRRAALLVVDAYWPAE
jgi:hypothetical protein